MEIVAQYAEASTFDPLMMENENEFKQMHSLWLQCEKENCRVDNKKWCLNKDRLKIQNCMKLLKLLRNQLNRILVGHTPVASIINNTSKYSDCPTCGLNGDYVNTLEDNYEARGELISSLRTCLATQTPVAVCSQGETCAEEEEEAQSIVENENPGTNIGNRILDELDNGGIPVLTPLVTKPAIPHFMDPLSVSPSVKSRTSATLQTAKILQQQDREKVMKQLMKLKPLFPPYDCKTDVLSNMSNFESAVKQYMLSPKEACMMLKMWAPSSIACRFNPPINGPINRDRDWFKDDKWGTEGDRLRAVSKFVTGDRDLDHSLAEMKVNLQDDPWVFASKFEQVYRLTHRIPPDQTPPDLLQYLVKKFTYLDPGVQMMAEEKDTLEGVLTIIGKARQNLMRKGVIGQSKVAIVTTNEGKQSLPEIPFRGICYYCNKNGHRQKECRKAKRDQRVTEGWHVSPSPWSVKESDQRGSVKMKRNNSPEKAGQEHHSNPLPRTNLYGPAREALRMMAVQGAVTNDHKLKPGDEAPLILFSD
ncbi:posterior protein-like [Spea bombifrons]|uniref:posterior protein-like n=1 Tax=Spea bombifrons TaxID=233779 RepID=UPI00234B4A99|nr:posterior protein-like [Spea bombifrons]